MGVPPEVMQKMMAAQGQPGGGAAASAGAPPKPQVPGQIAGQGGQGPGGSPNAQPQEKAGMKAHAMTNLSIAQNMMEQALTAFHPGDKEYKAILKCLNTLAPMSAKNDSSDLVPAEVMRMVQQLPQMGGGTDVQRAIMQQMKQGGGQAPQGQQQPMPQGA